MYVAQSLTRDRKDVGRGKNVCRVRHQQNWQCEKQGALVSG